MADTPTIETLARRQANDVTEMGITGEADVINQNETTMVTTTAFTDKRKWPGRPSRNNKMDSDTAQDSSVQGSKTNVAPQKIGRGKNPPNLLACIVLGAVFVIAADITVIIGIGLSLNFKY